MYVGLSLEVCKYQYYFGCLICGWLKGTILAILYGQDSSCHGCMILDLSLLFHVLVARLCIYCRRQLSYKQLDCKFSSKKI